MIKRILTYAIPVVAIAAAVVAILYIEPGQGDKTPAIQAIPQEAALLIKSDKPFKTWEKLSETNIIYEEFLSTQTGNELHLLLSSIDSTLHEDEALKPLLNNQDFWMALLPAEGGIQYLFSVGTQNRIAEAQLQQFIDQFSSQDFEMSNYHGAVTYHADGFHYTFYSGLWIFSTHQKSLEMAIDQASSGPSLLSNAGFKEVWNTKGDYIDANVFINYSTFPALPINLTDSSFHALVDQLSQFSSWSELDMTIKPNTLALNGFSYSSDSASHLLNLFNGQKAEHHDVVSILPSNTATLIHFGMSNFSGFYQQYQNYLNATQRLQQQQQHIQTLNERYGVNIEDQVLSWIENEVTTAIVEPFDQQFKEESLVVLKTNNLEYAQRKLLDLHNDLPDSLSSDSSIYRGYTIRSLPIPSLFNVLFGPLFSNVTGNVYTEINNYFVFGNSLAAVQSVINSYLSDRTLGKDQNFITYSQNISTKSNLFVYSNIARSVYLYEHFTNEKLTQEIDRHIDLYRKFEAFSLQVSRENDQLFYHNFFLKHNPVYKQQSTSLWELALDTTASFKPALVKNHYTQALEVAVQDHKNQLYLISNTGKILWKRQLDGPILGDIHQVDIYRNDKLQLLFNTPSSLYLIDRLGRDVEQFPVAFVSQASAPVSVLDYNSSKDYRFLVPTENNDIFNINKEGELVKGWRYEPKSAPINHPIEHVVVNKKDYIVAVDSLGNVYPLDRRGRVRIEIDTKFKVRSQSRFYVETGRTIRNSRLVGTDQNGNFISVYFDGNSESLNFHPFSKNHRFTWADIDNDASLDFIFADGDMLEVYNAEKEALFKLKVDSTITDGPYVYNFSNESKIGVALGHNDEILLVNKNGNVGENFPMHGNSAFSIADINKDGVYELVVIGKGGIIYTYVIE